LEAGGGIPCRPNPAATLLVIIIFVNAVVLANFVHFVHQGLELVLKSYLHCTEDHVGKNVIRPPIRGGGLPRPPVGMAPNPLGSAIL